MHGLNLKKNIKIVVLPNGNRVNTNQALHSLIVNTYE
jgi:hypothetical protein